MFKSPDFTYDASIRMWTADSADAAYEVLASPALRVYNLAKFYDMLAAETGREFLLSRYYSDYILLSNEDEQHAALRKLAAQRFHASARAVRLAATEAVNQITTRFSTPGTFDLIDDLISPLTHKVVVALAGVGTHVVASDILAPSRSLTKMRRIEAELVVMHDYVEAHFPSETPDSRATRVSLALIGYEPLKAGLGNNLATIIMQANGQRLNEIDWPQDLIATAVRKLVRVARDPASCPIPVVEISTESYFLAAISVMQRRYSGGETIAAWAVG